MQQTLRILKPEEYFIEEEPYYESVGDEIAVFEAAYRNGLPVLLGPTGCGKTRFMEHMAWRLKRALITVSCHDDLTASDLVGRFLVKGGKTIWVDGPLARAVRAGGICHLDEIVEARKDTTVVIHPLADDRRVLPMEKAGSCWRRPTIFALPSPTIRGIKACSMTSSRARASASWPWSSTTRRPGWNSGSWRRRPV